MRIKLDEKHWLNSDSQCYWISMDVEIKDGKNAGTIVDRRCSGYTLTFVQAVDSFIEKKIRTAEIGDFAKLAETIEDLKKTVEGWEVNLKKG